MRYEDISLHPEAAFKKIFKFFHLPFHPQVKKFLISHTTRNTTGVSSTFRDSKLVPFHWKEDFASNFTIVQEIQNKCEKAMQLWGYVSAANVDELLKLNPLDLPPWPEMHAEG